MDAVVLEASLYTVKAIAVLDNDGERVVAKYYDETYPTIKEQKEFEKNLFNKTHRANAEIIMLDGLTCVYRSNVDLFFYVMGSSNENELILVIVLNAFYDAISLLLRKNVEKRALMDNLDGVMSIVDEIVDGGVILETEASSIRQKVAIKTDDVPLATTAVPQALDGLDLMPWDENENEEL
ncbi:coatomer subunit zeta-1-like [Acropora millepora]|uniref:coatomer subunit zeta-1-like n=1 Tax=Acropora millepora TaxID=45264 RepID=UPI001CF31A22|nr:coatomer subunit zeta-1-like [Acropora millepora]